MNNYVYVPQPNGGSLKLHLNNQYHEVDNYDDWVPSKRRSRKPVKRYYVSTSKRD